MEQLKRFEELLAECQGQHLAFTVSYVPDSLDSGVPETGRHTRICSGQKRVNLMGKQSEFINGGLNKITTRLL